MINLENIEEKFKKVVSSEEWKTLQELYNNSTHVFLFGHGGNMAIADHAAVDSSRLTDKNVIAPGSGTLSTSIIGDTNFNDWLMHWLEMRSRGLDPKKCLVLGMSCSSTGESSASLATAVEWASKNGMNSFLFT